MSLTWLWSLARPVLLQLGIFGVGASLAWWLTSTSADNRVLELEKSQIAQRLTDAEASSAAFQAAWDRGDRIAANLSAANRAAANREKELEREINAATTGAVCLREPALRVLDRAGRQAADRLPATTGNADRANAGRVATDVDVVGWGIQARERYAECVRRYHALIDYNHQKAEP